MKNECDIVKDLLNSYDEGILSETSKKFVDNHLATCKNCKQILKEIKNQNETVSTQEIDYLKKIRKKLNIKNIITIVLSIIILFLILLDVLLFYIYYKKISVINQNNAIISSLKLNAEKYENLDNYSYTLTFLSNPQSITKYYVLGKSFASEKVSYKDEGKETYEYAYYPGINDDIIYVNNNGQKLISIYEENNSYLFDVSPCKLTYLGDMIYNQEIVKIEEDIPDKNYYTITSAHDVYAYNADNVYKDYRKYIVEKDTGIIVKAISDNFTYSIEYEIGNVTNEDIDRIANILNVDENTTLREYLD